MHGDSAGHIARVLHVTGISKTYGTTVAVDGVTFSVLRGEVVGLLGLNGAGKTTLINMVLGVLQPTSGTVKIEGIDNAMSRSQALAHTNFAAVYAPLPGNLTVAENLRIFGMLYNVSGLESRIEQLLEDFSLARFRDTKCGLLSSGEQTRVCLAKAMLNRPPLLLLDEPTASLDPATAQELRRKIRAIADDNRMGVLWTSHNMYEVEEVCDRVLLISKGRIVLEGDPKRLPAEHGRASMEELFIAVANDGVSPKGKAA